MTQKRDAGETRPSRNSDTPDTRCYFVTHSARIPCPERASLGVRPENVTRARQDYAGSVLRLGDAFAGTAAA